jgi:hypothetical protein
MIVLAISVIVGMKNALAVPIERKAAVGIATLTNDTSPLRVALLSDIHLGNRGMDSNRLVEIVAQVNESRPDLILIAGDFVTGESQVQAAQIASGLKAVQAASFRQSRTGADLGRGVGCRILLWFIGACSADAVRRGYTMSLCRCRAGQGGWPIPASANASSPCYGLLLSDRQPGRW